MDGKLFLANPRNVALVNGQTKNLAQERWSGMEVLGLVIGIVESLSGFYLPDGFKDTAAYIVVLIMLMVKPNGLFGEKLRKKV